MWNYNGGNMKRYHIINRVRKEAKEETYTWTPDNQKAYHECFKKRGMTLPPDDWTKNGN